MPSAPDPQPPPVPPAPDQRSPLAPPAPSQGASPAPPRRPTPRPAPLPSAEPLAAAQEAERLLTRAHIQLRRGLPSEAEAAARALLVLRPHYAPAHELLADVRLAQGDLPGGIAALKDALAAEPGRATAEAKLARAALQASERARMQSMGMAYAASDASLMRLPGGAKGGGLSVAASLLIPGLGQYVNGETAKGIVLAAVYFLALGLLSLLPDTQQMLHSVARLFAIVPEGARRRADAPIGGMTWLLLVVITADWLYAVIDAALVSRRAARPAPSPKDGWQV